MTAVFSIPWLELAVLAPLVFAAAVGFVRNPVYATRWAAVGCGVAFVAAVVAWVGQFTGTSNGTGPVFRVDELSAPLVPVLALLHLLTAASTTKRKAATFGAARFLISHSLRLAAFACLTPGVLVGLLIACTVPPYLDLRAHGRPTRAYVLHMGAFTALLTAGWALSASGVPALGSVLLLAAALIRGGILPAHVWIPDLFANGSLTSALLSTTPLVGVYAAVRLAVPDAPSGILTAVTALSLLTALYSAGMAVVQTEVRRFVAHLFISFASLVLVGLEVHTPESTTGALALWFSLMPAATCLGLVVRATEDRYGALSLTTYHGLADRSPVLATGFLLSGLACVGFPGMLGFVAGELMIDGTLRANPWVGVVVILVSALNGIAVLRAYGLLFAGRRTADALEMPVSRPERVAILVLVGILLCGGLYPQPLLASRARAAAATFPAVVRPE